MQTYAWLYSPGHLADFELLAAVANFAEARSLADAAGAWRPAKTDRLSVGDPRVASAAKNVGELLWRASGETVWRAGAVDLGRLVQNAGESLAEGRVAARERRHERRH